MRGSPSPFSHFPSQISAMTIKRTPKSNGFLPDFAGFEIPDKFIIGYAIDYNEVFRDLQHICIINRRGIERYAVWGFFFIFSSGPFEAYQNLIDRYHE